MENIQLNCPTFNLQAKDKFVEWRCFYSEVENMEEKQKTALAINRMGHDGSELVNSLEMATRDTAKEGIKSMRCCRMNL